MKKIHLVIPAFLFLTGCCAIHNGGMVSSAVLTQNNFKIIAHVKGEAQAVTFLGFGGGFGRTQLYEEARRDMYAKYPLKAGQAYANIVVDRYNSFWFIGSTGVYTINADVVQFLEDKYFTPDTLAPSMEKAARFNQSYNGFKLDDKVYIKADNGFFEGTIILLEEEKATVKFMDNSGQLRRQSFPYSALERKK